MKILFLLFSFFILNAQVLMAQDKVVGRLYFQDFLGHVHKNPSKASSSLTTIQCAYSVKVIEDLEIRPPKGWVYVKVGDDRGYIIAKSLSEKRPECFQEKYPKFYLNLNLDLSEMYFWGRLSDQYLSQESKVK
jgi:hypothetical protein